MKKQKRYHQSKKSCTKQVDHVVEATQSTASKLYQRGKDCAANVLEKSSQVLTNRNKQRDACWLLDYPIGWKLTH